MGLRFKGLGFRAEGLGLRALCGCGAWGFTLFRFEL